MSLVPDLGSCTPGVPGVQTVQTGAVGGVPRWCRWRSFVVIEAWSGLDGGATFRRLEVRRLDRTQGRAVDLARRFVPRADRAGGHRASLRAR